VLKEQVAGDAEGGRRAGQAGRHPKTPQSSRALYPRLSRLRRGTIARRPLGAVPPTLRPARARLLD
jgi:hypothetical protein